MKSIPSPDGPSTIILTEAQYVAFMFNSTMKFHVWVNEQLHQTARTIYGGKMVRTITFTSAEIAMLFKLTYL